MPLNVNRPTNDSQVSSTLRSLIAAVAVLSLLVSSVGPLFDHHFAERQPHHQHLFFGLFTGEHTHSYGLGNHHYPSQWTADTAPPDGVVFLTSTDGSGPGVAVVTSLLVNQEMDFPATDDSWLLSGDAGDDRVLTEATIRLPKKPPRV